MKKINGLNTYSFEEVFHKMLSSKESRARYEEELGRLRLVRQIREMRAKKKLTQKTLAQKTQMPQSVIARIESGEHSFSLSTLSRIAKAFNKEIKLA